MLPLRALAATTGTAPPPAPFLPPAFEVAVPAAAVALLDHRYQQPTPITARIGSHSHARPELLGRGGMAGGGATGALGFGAAGFGPEGDASRSDGVSCFIASL